MVFKSRIKWIALFVMILSVGSLVVHLSMTKSSGVQLAYYARDTLWQDFDSLLGAQDFRNKHLWRPVKSLETLQPYANPRISFPAPSSKNNGFIYAKIFGGFDKIRSSYKYLFIILLLPEYYITNRNKNVDCFKHWVILYKEHLEASVALLRKLVDEGRITPLNYYYHHHLTVNRTVRLKPSLKEEPLPGESGDLKMARTTAVFLAAAGGIAGSALSSCFPL
ncbi:unnamed protein product [Microthlaspi erraticum]|uniref:Uncharacterized protein n=1 Tax=Microthlaspi erraticum TaxID=1685480 RepID=A0A6D2JN31_9BRAS|nr:unnamed protein product [Microthlaspi erraticum]